jgi:hypothetical protein
LKQRVEIAFDPSPSAQLIFEPRSTDNNENDNNDNNDNNDKRQA